MNNFKKPALIVSLVGLFAMVACDRTGSEYLNEPNPDYPGVLHLGAFEPIPLGDFKQAGERPALLSEWGGYQILGPTQPGEFGGATATFLGTGGEICLIADPESVFWNQSIAALDPKKKWSYPDNYNDDGDVDIEAGLSAFYTGSPGVEMGDFEGVYEDSLGNQIYIEYNECTIIDTFGDPFGHAGRGTFEYCTIDTSAHAGKEYTIVMNTWSIPLDDDLLSYAFAIVDGACDSVGELNECTLSNEVRDDNFSELESAFCAGEQAEYCEANPDMCGDLAQNP